MTPALPTNQIVVHGDSGLSMQVSLAPHAVKIVVDEGTCRRGPRISRWHDSTGLHETNYHDVELCQMYWWQGSLRYWHWPAEDI